ncbi:MAG TPA: FAD-binding oxidoreductase [Chloroflexi bacterium]|nr:FAD-binding oxidoreductase [Chloroflexota bacterium]
MLKETDLIPLRQIFPPTRLITHPVELLTYEVDAGLDRGMPEAVVLPETTEEVVRLVHWAREHQVPLVARGAGTGLSGGAVAHRGGVIVNFARMDRLLTFDEAGRTVVVQPGMVNLTLDGMARARGLYFPPDPASQRSATIGGNIAENAGGPHCFKYGVTTNYVLGLEVVLADGQVVRMGGAAYDYPEYDFVGLLTGSEGTLGIITEATLRLIGLPPAVKTMMATFASVEQAGEAVSAVIARGLVPATMEMMDQKIIGIVEEYTHAGLPVEAGALLIIEVDGYPESLDQQAEEIAEVVRAHGCQELRIARTEAERQQIWYGRKSAAGAISRLSPAYYLVDGTVPRSRLAEALARTNEIGERYGLRIGYLFHAGDGNLHPLVLFDPADPEETERVHRAGREMMELVVALNGSITGEHGVGLEKRDFMPLMYGAAELQAMQEIKALFDPEGLLTPGKVSPASFAPPPPPTAPAPAEPPPSPFAPATPQEAADFLRACQAAGRRVWIAGRADGPPAHPAFRPAPKDALLVTSAMQGIVEAAPADLYVTVRAGTPLAALQEELASQGVWVPLLSPWPEATVGGLVSANLNAPLRMRYGGVRDLVLALQVVLPDGRPLRFGRPVVKNVAGYDMAKLFVGAWGTLGLITEVTLRLVPRPRARRSLLVAVDDLAQGVAWGSALLRRAIVASAILLEQDGEDGATPGAMRLIYTAEGHPQDVEAELRGARALLEQAGAPEVVEEEMGGSDRWSALLARPDGFTVRIGLPPRDLPGYVPAQLDLLAGLPLIADFASGQLHLHLPNNRESGERLEALRRAALALGGYAVVTAAPPAPEVAVDWWGYRPEVGPLMQALKHRWDPARIVNANVVG